MLHGHGVVPRQQRGPESPGGEPVGAVIDARRYECQYADCGTVVRVLPASARAFKHFSGAAMGMALCLWGVVGLSAGHARDRISDWRIRGAAARGWRSLTRWADQVTEGKLFAELGVRWLPVDARTLAAAAATALSGHAPPAMRDGPPESLSFIGACHVR